MKLREECLNYFRGLKRQQWPFQSPPDRANPQQFPGECFPGDIRQSPEAPADNVTLRNSFKSYFFCPGLYGAAESHKLALGSIRVLRPLCDILEFGWALRGPRQQWPFQSLPDRANPQQFPGECFPGDIRQSPEASPDNVTLRNRFKRYFFCPGLYGAAESHKLALGSIRVLRPLLDILEFGWALRGPRFHFPKLF
ncbi:hypothetical protein CEXT_86091 [Caerostris extrusa]|uniref:Uncharacterized protein n=1 Tax=Caerostris extrusa TaxID=172846 RepID=A0AAV4SAZ7_CAEEX|nr:hypothetical protein CEXT_86091 [Caerostris extrusa]